MTDTATNGDQETITPEAENELLRQHVARQDMVITVMRQRLIELELELVNSRCQTREVEMAAATA